MNPVEYGTRERERSARLCHPNPTTQTPYIFSFFFTKDYTKLDNFLLQMSIVFSGSYIVPKNFTSIEMRPIILAVDTVCIVRSSQVEILSSLVQEYVYIYASVLSLPAHPLAPSST